MAVPPLAETLSVVELAMVPPSAATVPTVSPMPMALPAFPPLLTSPMPTAPPLAEAVATPPLPALAMSSLLTGSAKKSRINPMVFPFRSFPFGPSPGGARDQLAARQHSLGPRARYHRSRRLSMAAPWKMRWNRYPQRDSNP